MDFEALLAKATPGPWAWFGNARNNDLYLATVRCGRQYVMGFQRWGMREAQPTFRFKGRLVPASDRLKFEVGDQAVTGVKAAKADESVYRQDIRDIDAPDAQLIVAAVNALPDLLAENKALRARVSALEAERDELKVRVQALREDLAAMGAGLDAAEAEARRCREGLHRLEQAEAAYRGQHDVHGDDSRESGRAWDLMRRAGDAARALVSERQEGGE